MELLVVNGTNPKVIHEFYSKLVIHVQILETMGKLNMIDGYGMSEQSFHNHPEHLHGTSLIWKVGHPDLDKNKAGSLCLKSVLTV